VCTDLAEQYAEDLYQDYRNTECFPQKIKRKLGKTGMFYIGNAQIYCINNIGGT
jgi:hypothetical protein